MKLNKENDSGSRASQNFVLRRQWHFGKTVVGELFETPFQHSKSGFWFLINIENNFAKCTSERAGFYNFWLKLGAERRER